MRRYQYRKMTGDEISAALDATGLTAGQFARIIGARHNGPRSNDSTVLQWLSGERDAPTYLPALFALLLLPGGVQCAREAAGRYIIDEAD